MCAWPCASLKLRLLPLRWEIAREEYALTRSGDVARIRASRETAQTVRRECARVRRASRSVGLFARSLSPSPLYDFARRRWAAAVALNEIENSLAAAAAFFRIDLQNFFYSAPTTRQ